MSKGFCDTHLTTHLLHVKGFCDTHLTAHVTIREGFLTHFSTHFTIQDHADSLSLMRAVEFDQAFTFAYSGSKLCSKVVGSDGAASKVGSKLLSICLFFLAANRAFSLFFPPLLLHWIYA